MYITPEKGQCMTLQKIYVYAVIRRTGINYAENKKRSWLGATTCRADGMQLGVNFNLLNVAILKKRNWLGEWICF